MKTTVKLTVACVCFALTTTSIAQSVDPPYLKEFPSVDRVMREIQGSDPKDTQLRQYGAFRWLRKFVEDSTGSRWYNNQLTAEERRIYGDYDVAFNRLGKVLDFPIGGYGTEVKFRNDLFTRFGMTQVLAQLRKTEAEFKARHEAVTAANRPPAAPSNPAAPAGPPRMSNDPGAVATRRCLELGGTDLHCLGKGVSTGFDDLLGLNQIRRNLDVEKPKLTGLRMVGAYKASSGLAIEFLENNLRITGCGKLIVDGRQYDVQRSGNQLQIRIQNTPQPILTGLGPGGKISAPAAAEITGSIITGYTNTWVEKRYTSDNSVVPGSGHWEQTPIFATKTERCAIGTLLPGPPAPVVGDHDGMLALFADAFSALAGDPSATKNLIAPGPRMAGVYTGSGGLKVEFRPEGAILDCQDAHAAVPYVVSNGASGVAVVVKNGGSPMTLTQQPDGALAGNGSIDVHGRLVTGSGANGITFRPVAATCAVGTLAAK